MWSVVMWGEVMWGEVMWSEVMWSVVMWGEVTWFMWSDFILKWSEMKLKWSEVSYWMKWSELRWIPCRYSCYAHYGDLILREFDYIVIISFRYILYCVCFNLYCGGFKLFCNMCVCVCVCVCVYGVGFVMCGCLDNVNTLNLFGYPDWGFSVLFPQL
jgi:hypothetical protein